MANQREICAEMTTQLLLTIEMAAIFYLFYMTSNERSWIIHKNPSFQLVIESLMIHLIIQFDDMLFFFSSSEAGNYSNSYSRMT